MAGKERKGKMGIEGIDKERIRSFIEDNMERKRARLWKLGYYRGLSNREYEVYVGTCKTPFGIMPCIAINRLDMPRVYKFYPAQSVVIGDLVKVFAELGVLMESFLRRPRGAGIEALGEVVEEAEEKGKEGEEREEEEEPSMEEV